MLKQQLDPITFGRELLVTGDLDPLYIALHKAQLEKPLLCQWLLAYFCFYNVGLASWITSSKSYWDAMQEVPASGTKYPRGAERRHFRGDFACRAVAKLKETFHRPEDLFTYIASKGLSSTAVMKQVKTLYGFGEWISWKVADISERVGLLQVQFTDDDYQRMFSSSQQGAAEIAVQYGFQEEPVLVAHRFLKKELRKHLAPPDYKRPINVQETETIFCKYHSHLSGHYPVRKDSVEIKHSLEKFPCSISSTLLKAGKAGGIW